MSSHALQELSQIAADGDGVQLEVSRLRAEAFRQQREYLAAIEVLDGVLEHVPDDLESLMTMAWCYKRTEQLDRAIDAMQSAYKAHPDEPVVLYNLACYFTLAGDKPQAISWLGRSLRMESALRELIPEESDFDSLRHDPDFLLVVRETGNEG